MRDKLGEGGFGEVWLAAHKKTGDKRVFKFCFQADRLRSLRRVVMLFRLMKEALGNRDDIARVIDWQFDEPPYFLESEYTAGGNFSQWAEDQGGLDEIPLATRLELIAQIAEALSAAHMYAVRVFNQLIYLAYQSGDRRYPGPTRQNRGVLRQRGRS